ncbi:YicC/YloC family endoribonuclease [Marichromatium gracile]|uniref:YicC family protein n=1 Tax=Marichromatium gracile TaxID=1048 RepID=A0ABR5VPD8_MARGR|nr:YicC/YloC family endoribonuclease [Marichromatium gracile]KXX66287.1 hypothetical protein AY586_05935 [Marichromatium gracile]
MIKSMTAFARESSQSALGELTWELRTVNHRYLESMLRLPEELRALDTRIRARLGERLHRGKVDCALRFNPGAGAPVALELNRPLVEQLLAAGDALAGLSGRDTRPTPFELLRWPGVIREQERDLDQIGAAAMALLDQAIDGLIATREREGARLAQLVRERCDRLEVCVVRVRTRMPEVIAETRARLAERLAELREELDEGRLEQEIVLVATKLDVDEEMDRLTAHIAEVRSVLERDEPIGRRLDFLMQELNRETNTIGSKSSDVEITRTVVDMKVLIEQMREQIQNIE